MSNNRTLVIQWGSNIAGRENIGLEVFMNVNQYYQRLVNEGNLGSFQTIINENGNVGDVAGLMILTGTKEQIQTINNSDKHVENLTKGGHVVHNLNVQAGYCGDAIPERIQKLTAWRKELGL